AAGYAETRQKPTNRPFWYVLVDSCVHVEWARGMGAEMNALRSWHKSSFSDAAGNQCVEVAWTGRDVLVRDSKDTMTGLLAFSAHSWNAFVAAAPGGHADPAHE
ncbi:DUF397 domain-containing protein, partial [Streptomyces sp. NPDC001275]